MTLRPNPRPVRLILEFAGLFIVVPTAMFAYRGFFATFVIPSILLASGGCLIALLRDPAFDRQTLWNASGLRKGLTRIAGRFVPAATLVAVVFRIVEPELWLNLPGANIRLWMAIMLLYPVLSVYPQELIFRTFIFHRYRTLFPGRNTMCVASAVAFGMAHVFFANPVAPILSAAGGWLFARTYLRSHSTLQSVIDHGLWGDFVFTVGLGWYFWGGSIS